MGSWAPPWKPGGSWTDVAGPVVGTREVSAHLGLSPSAVVRRVHSAKLLGVRLRGNPRSRWAYPAWQFAAGVDLALPVVLRAAGYDSKRPESQWLIASWLYGRISELGGASPQELLSAGRVDEVLALVPEVARALSGASKPDRHRT